MSTSHKLRLKANNLLMGDILVRFSGEKPAGQSPLLVEIGYILGLATSEQNNGLFFSDSFVHVIENKQHYKLLMRTKAKCKANVFCGKLGMLLIMNSVMGLAKIAQKPITKPKHEICPVQ